MIDLHTHILFGMDDGAKNLEESLALIDSQIHQGVQTIVVTPHYHPSKQSLTDFVEKRDTNLEILSAAVRDSGRNIKILKGAEIFYTSDLLEMDLSQLVIENTDYILLEFTTHSRPSNLRGQMHHIMSMGYIPILAHIERYSFFREDLKLLVDLIRQGVLTQVNASSFLDKSEKNYITACMKHNHIHLVATDAHSKVGRPPELERALKSIESNYGKENYLQFMHNAQSVVENETLDVEMPTPLRRILGHYT